ncbi:coiled-coil domain-containing protein 81-like [Excalfactoria chinensis]|uniref:coiled-coil domain-containing protein 81-like n=1 Tax=Excalfactoria chinensis TaxID=46218 RepID=UPI003B3AA1EB
MLRRERPPSCGSGPPGSPLIWLQPLLARAVRAAPRRNRGTTGAVLRMAAPELCGRTAPGRGEEAVPGGAEGVWIPTFGSFDTISKEIRTEDRTVTLCWPVFGLTLNLMSCRESLPAHRKVEALKCSQVAAAASVSRQTAQTCIQSTVLLLSGCLQNGENVAVVLKGVGVLLIDGLSFEMKFYYDFLEKLSGKENFRRALQNWAPAMSWQVACCCASVTMGSCQHRPHCHRVAVATSDTRPPWRG